MVAKFADGTEFTGSMIVGADGAQSAVRQALLGPEKGKALGLGVVLYNVNACYGNAAQALALRKIHPMHKVALQPDRALSLWTSDMHARSLSKFH